MLKRRFDRLFSSGTGIQVLALLVVSLVFASIFILCGYYLCDDAVDWETTVGIFMDPGNFLQHGDSHCVFRFVVAICGAILVSTLLVSTFTNMFENIGASVRQGKRRYAFNHHILILGNGKKLPHILKALSAERRDVVVMSESPVNVKGEYVYYNGRRDDRDELVAARADKADIIYIIGEDDEPGHDSRSLASLELLKEICRDAGHDIHCYLTINDIATQEVFQYYRQSENGHLLLVDVINDSEYYAEQLMVGTDFLPVIRPGEDRECCIVIIGTGSVAQSTAYTAAHLCHYPSFASGRKTTIAFVGIGMRGFMDEMRAARPSLFGMSEYQYMNAKGANTKYVAGHGDILDIRWEFIDAPAESDLARHHLEGMIQSPSKDVRIIVCGSNDAESIRHTLHLPRTAYGIPSIAVYLEDSEELLDRANATGMYGHLVGYGPAAKSDDSLFLNRSTRGQRVNYIYEQKYGDRSLSQEAAWYRIPEMSKFSSIYCANAMVLRRKCYDLTAPDRAAAYDSEHRRWMMSVLIMGQSYGAQTDKSRFIHADLVPFDNLSEEEQSKDAVLIDNCELICG